MPSWDEIYQWLIQTENLTKLILVPLAFAMFWWLVKWIGKGIELSGTGLRGLARRMRDPVDERLRSYRETLDSQTFQIKHAWMKEGQTLDDILVSVVVDSDGFTAGIEDWSRALRQFFTGKPAQRLAVVGGPGSGKSVALKVAAREAWTLPNVEDDGTLIPILMSFADYRESNFEIVSAVRQSLFNRNFRFTLDSDAGADDTSAELAAIESTLRKGQLFLIVDALDELDKEDRTEAAKQLIDDLNKYQNCPVIFSCRTAAWHGQFADLKHEKVDMADFTPVAIKRFVTQWGFPPPKTSHELIETIQAQPHIANLSRSPLMLTIIAFLYSHPRYHLPENRAEFYDICSRALLGEWDLSANPNRANRFERHHKEYILSELAYRHLMGPTPDADLDEDECLKTISEVMEKHSLRPDENMAMLREIRENSGLLVRLPPSGLRFPHQTFLEFFAAKHVKNSLDQETIFINYKLDPNRWREVLLLFIGLNTNPDEVTAAISRLHETEPLEVSVTALADARAVKPDIAQDILDTCRRQIEMKLDRQELPAKLVTLLGHVASNERAAHSELATSTLKFVVEKIIEMRGTPLFSNAIETVLLASLRRPSKDIAELVVNNIENLNLGRLIPSMGENAFVLTTKIIGDNHLELNKKIEWIGGLRRAGGIEPLYELLGLDLPKEIQGPTAAALFELASEEKFWEKIEDWSIPTIVESPRISSIYNEFGWPFAPISESGKKMALSLAKALSNAEPSVLRQAVPNEKHRQLIYASMMQQQPKMRPEWAIGCFSEHAEPFLRDAKPVSLQRFWKSRQITKIPVNSGIVFIIAACFAAPIWAALASLTHLNNTPFGLTGYQIARTLLPSYIIVSVLVPFIRPAPDETITFNILVSLLAPLVFIFEIHRVGLNLNKLPLRYSLFSSVSLAVIFLTIIGLGVFATYTRLKFGLTILAALMVIQLLFGLLLDWKYPVSFLEFWSDVSASLRQLMNKSKP